MGIKNKKSCFTCSRMIPRGQQMRYYYLGRPCGCCPEMWDEEQRQKRLEMFKDDSEMIEEIKKETPESYAKECPDFTKEKIFKNGQHDCGSISHWHRQDNGEIVPWCPEWIREPWFGYGFNAALEAFGFPANFEKNCKNCSHSSWHYVNKCEKNEGPCERWEIDIHKFFDKRWYGHLCKPDYCGNYEICTNKKDIWSEYPNTKCETWIPIPDKEEENEN